MSDLMAEVTQQGSKRFVQTKPAFFANVIVCLRETHCNQAARVPGGHGNGHIGNELKSQGSQRRWLRCRFRCGSERQSQGQESVNQPALGELEPVPAFAVSEDTQVRHDNGQSTRSAKGILVADGHEPVADGMHLAVFAQSVKTVHFCGEGFPLVPDRGNKRADVEGIREKP
jgi:hypothetical protein